MVDFPTVCFLLACARTAAVSPAKGEKKTAPVNGGVVSKGGIEPPSVLLFWINNRNN